MSEDTLLIPGPTGISRRVREVLSQPQMGHTSPRFRRGFQELLKLTLHVFRSERGYPYALTGSGTVAMEAAVINLIEPKEKVLVLDTGFFGNRFVDIGRIHGANVDILKFQIGRHANPSKVEERLSGDTYKALFITHVDASCGIVNPVEELVSVARRHNVLTVVDTVAGLGGCELEFDHWGIDLALTASQKALGGPPGAALLVLSEAALETIQNRRSPIQSYYMDLLRWRTMMNDSHKYVCTPATQVMLACKEALQEVKEEGLDVRIRRHRLIANSIVEAIKALHLDLVVEDGYRSNTVTGIYAPARRAAKIQMTMRKLFKIQIAVGLGTLKDSMLRIGHFANISVVDVITLLSALEISMQSAGLDVKIGSSVEAATPILKTLV